MKALTRTLQDTSLSPRGGFDMAARDQARRQWTETPCGGVHAAAHGSLAYFDEVVRARYEEQNWMHGYFGYEQFAGKRVLEIGVGHGTDLLQFSLGGATCAAVDITQKHLELARQHFDVRGRDVLLLEGDATAIPAADSSFDCVYSFGVLHHVPEIERCTAEVNRVLKPGGTFYIALYHKWSVFHLFNKIFWDGILKAQLLRIGYSGVLATVERGADGVTIKPYVRTYSKSEVRGLLKDFNVQDVSVHQLSAGDFRHPWIGRLAKPFIPALDRHLGWYVTATAQKPA